jgi:HSP20 family protein
MSLIRYTPYTDFDAFPAGLRLFQDSVNRLFAEPNARPWVPAVDILETENELVLKADVPEMEMKDIDVRMENGTLTLRGERKFEHKEKNNGGGYHRLERSYGTFERVFTLPETVDVEKVKADYKAGVLTITLPKKEIAKPRAIKVNINN